MQPLSNYPPTTLNTVSTLPRTSLEQPESFSSSHFGKVKGIEVLSFVGAELERTLHNQTTFGTLGVLQVLYFANFDRFVLSLNDWKYVLLRRIPITASGDSLTGPISYSLPSYGGHFTLRIPKIAHIEALQNLDTILMNNSRLSYEGTENMGQRAMSPDDRFRGQVMEPPLEELPQENVFEEPMQDPGQGTQPGVLSRKDKMKRGFQVIASKLTKRMPRKAKHNLNLLQKRDIESIKRTSEIMAPVHMFPTKEVERWITLNKEVANLYNFEPELPPELDTEVNRMRGYGSVDLGQGCVLNPLSSKLLASGITGERPNPLQAGSLTAGTTTVTHTHGLDYSKPKLRDKIRAKLPGTHHYYGEKVEGNTYGTYSTPHLSTTEKIKEKITGHTYHAHEGLANPVIPVGTQSVYTNEVPGGYIQQPTVGTIPLAGPKMASSIPQYNVLPVNAPIDLRVGTVVGETIISSVPLDAKMMATIGAGGNIINQTPLGENITPTMTSGLSQQGNIIGGMPTTGVRVVDNTLGTAGNVVGQTASHIIPNEQLNVLRGQEHYTHDMA